MKTAQFNTHGRHSIHLAFDETTLETLIREGKLHAADFNCLDRSSICCYLQQQGNYNHEYAT